MITLQEGGDHGSALLSVKLPLITQRLGEGRWGLERGEGGLDKKTDLYLSGL